MLLVYELVALLKVCGDRHVFLQRVFLGALCVLLLLLSLDEVSCCTEHPALYLN